MLIQNCKKPFTKLDIILFIQHLSMLLCYMYLLRQSHCSHSSSIAYSFPHNLSKYDEIWKMNTIIKYLSLVDLVVALSPQWADSYKSTICQILCFVCNLDMISVLLNYNIFLMRHLPIKILFIMISQHPSSLKQYTLCNGYQ